jgi:adenylate cyclase
MIKGDLEHRLAALMSADVVGYSRLMAEDEVGTIRTLTAYRSKMTTVVIAYRGRVVNFAGDNMLAEFTSALDAVNCAIDIQLAVANLNTKLADSRHMKFRIGINLGDVAVEGDLIYGDGVNIAACLEALARPGGICISNVVYDQVNNKLDIRCVDIGEQKLKKCSKKPSCWSPNLRWDMPWPPGPTGGLCFVD